MTDRDRLLMIIGALRYEAMATVDIGQTQRLIAAATQLLGSGAGLSDELERFEAAWLAPISPGSQAPPCTGS